MNHLPLSALLDDLTRIIQELARYMSDDSYQANPREYLLVNDLRARAENAQTLCTHLNAEFWKRMNES